VPPLPAPVARRLPRGGLPAWARGPWALGGLAAAGAVALALRARSRAGGDPAAVDTAAPYRGSMSQYDSSALDGMNNIQAQLAGQADAFQALLADYLSSAAAPDLAPSGAAPLPTVSTRYLSPEQSSLFNALSTPTRRALTTFTPSPTTNSTYSMAHQNPDGSWVY
jgi:hypothetical protein